MMRPIVFVPGRCVSHGSSEGATLIRLGHVRFSSIRSYVESKEEVSVGRTCYHPFFSRVGWSFVGGLLHQWCRADKGYLVPVRWGAFTPVESPFSVFFCESARVGGKLLQFQ